MASGFSWAGQPIAQGEQRASTVRPRDDSNTKLVQPITEGVSGGQEAVNEAEMQDQQEGGEQEEVEKLNEKYQQFKTQMEEMFDDEHGMQYRDPPMVKPPPMPTKEQFERHQTTHTPFAPWCKDCFAARAVRQQHPSKGRKAIIVPDIQTGAGPTTVSIDYMYLHERRSQNRDAEGNPPHMIMIEHKYGRCWAYRVSNKGVLENAYWLPERMVQDLENVGMKQVQPRDLMMGRN